MPSKIPRGKRQINVLIDEKLYRKLVKIAPLYYGKGRGGISAIVEEALRQFLSGLEAAHTKHKTILYKNTLINPPMSVREEFNRFIETVRNELGYVPPAMKTRLARAFMIEAFRRAKDERTQNKKLHNWYLMGFIKPLPHDIKPQSPNDWSKVPSIEIVARGGA